MFIYRASRAAVLGGVRVRRPRPQQTHVASSHCPHPVGLGHEVRLQASSVDRCYHAGRSVRPGIVLAGTCNPTVTPKRHISSSMSSLAAQKADFTPPDNLGTKVNCFLSCVGTENLLRLVHYAGLYYGIWFPSKRLCTQWGQLPQWALQEIYIVSVKWFL